MAVYTAAPGLPLLQTLVPFLTRACAEQPEAMCDARVYLPSKRACQALKLAFAEAGGGVPQFLPRLLPIGDLDESELLFAFAGAAQRLKPAMPRLVQRFRFAELIRSRYRPAGPSAISVEQSVRLADSLLALWDELEREQVPFERLRRAVPDSLSDHWQESMAFLDTVGRYWPEITAITGQVSLAAHRNALLALEAELLGRAPPEAPVIAAGSTGSVAATADLLAAVARLPNGCLILPGLDREMDEASWQALDESHPQWQLKHLLGRIGIGREAVREWPGGEEEGRNPGRAALIREVMRPSATVEGWHPLPREAAEGLAGVHLLPCRDSLQEARVAGLLLRYHAQTPGRTVAVVTPDRELARLMTLAAERHGITLDDTAGVPLLSTGPGMIFQLVAEAVVGRFRPVRLLALLKHPCCGLGLDPDDREERVLELERAALRGLPPTYGPDGLKGMLPPSVPAALSDLIDRLHQATEAAVAVFARQNAPFGALLDAHLAAAEAVCAAAGGANFFLAGEEAEALHECLTGLREAAEAIAEMPPDEYLTVVRDFLASTPFRRRDRSLSRFRLLTPIEARLLATDVVIIAGCREGVWPPMPAPDPWLNRPLRAVLGLPMPERHIGQSAHDICMLMGHGQVYLTWPEKVGGEPADPSRFVERLEVVRALAARYHGEAGAEAEPHDWRDLADRLDAPEAVTPMGRPAPLPPEDVRARAFTTLSVTGVETLMHNPYAFYARAMLELTPWEPLEAEPSARELGQYLHRVMERFGERYDTLPEDRRHEALLAIGRAEAERVYARFPGVLPFVLGRLEGIAPQLLAWEEARRPRIAALEVEVKGRWQVPGLPVTLVAKADRIEREVDGRAVIVDFKSSATPTDGDILTGVRNQLTLEALMLLGGGFTAEPPAGVARLEYVPLKRDAKPKVVDDPAAVIAQGEEGLQRLLRTFLSPETPFPATPGGDGVSDYAHLIRAAEWQG